MNELLINGRFPIKYLGKTQLVETSLWLSVLTLHKQVFPTDKLFIRSKNPRQSQKFTPLQQFLLIKQQKH